MKILWPKKQTSVLIAKNLNSIDNGESLRDYSGKRASSDRVDIPIHMDTCGVPIKEFHRFLYEKDFYSSGSSSRTIDTYAECLLCWLRYIEAANISWQVATVRSILAFRNSMKGSLETRARKLKPATINLRVIVVSEFYKYYWGSQVQQATAGSVVATKNLEALRTTRLRVNADKRGARSLTSLGCNKLHQQLTGVHRIIFLWCLCTGMRTGSVLAITARQFLNLESDSSNSFVEANVKGGRKQKIYVPMHLIAETRRYVEVQRLLDGGAVLLHTDDKLFINSKAQIVTRGCYYAAYRRACKATGLRSHPHQARTTFATFMERSLQSLKDTQGLDPVKIIQGLLGHASATTTLDYLENIVGRHIDVLNLLDAHASAIGPNHVV